MLDRREAAKRSLSDLVDRMRDDSVGAVLSVMAAGSGTLVITVPRSTGKPVETAAVTGGLQLRLFEDREIRVP